MSLILGIDTSCDDTSVAIVEDGQRVLANVISSQDDLHAEFGGVVPELASRRHVTQMEPIIREAFHRAGLQRADVDAIAVTWTPGLIGSLVIGIAAAKNLAWVHDKPLVPVNHLHAHAYSPQVDIGPDEQALPYPYMCLVVSGGHTLLYYVRSAVELHPLGTTVDDAAGEAFDKVAKLLDLGYPGGPVISKLAADGDPTRYKLPRPKMRDKDFDFSFSGLKSAARRVQELEGDKLNLNDFAASVQEAIVEVLVAKLFRAAKEASCPAVSITGGVAANPCLRQRVTEEADRLGLAIRIPPRALCTDNGAMIAGLGYHLWKSGKRADFDLNGKSSEYLGNREFAWPAELQHLQRLP